MAKGLDQLEGDVIEIGGLILLGLLAVLMFTTWKAPRVWADGKVLDLKGAIDTFAGKLDSFLLDPLGSLHSLSGAKPDEAHAGVSPESTTNTVDYNSPAVAADDLSMYDQQANQYAGELQ
jgi:hypothetical protein